MEATHSYRVVLIIDESSAFEYTLTEPKEKVIIEVGEPTKLFTAPGHIGVIQTRLNYEVPGGYKKRLMDV